MCFRLNVPNHHLPLSCWLQAPFVVNLKFSFPNVGTCAPPPHLFQTGKLGNCIEGPHLSVIRPNPTKIILFCRWNEYWKIWVIWVPGKYSVAHVNTYIYVNNIHTLHTSHTYVHSVRSTDHSMLTKLHEQSLLTTRAFNKKISRTPEKTLNLPVKFSPL